MLQDLAKLQENADETLATRIKLATGTSALYDDALKVILDSGQFSDGKTPYRATVSCPKLTDEEKVEASRHDKVNPPDVELNNALDVKVKVDIELSKEELHSATPLKSYQTCLENRYERFNKARKEATNKLLSYLRVYKIAYSTVARKQCELLINSTKEELTNKVCDNPETFIEYLDTEIETVSKTTSKPRRTRKTKEVKVLAKHNYLFDKITTSAKFRELYVKQSDTEVTLCTDKYNSTCEQSFVDLEVDTLNTVSKVIAAYKQLSHPAIYFNWGNIEFLINKYIEVRPGSAPLWKNFARQLQKKLVALNEEAGVQPATGQRTISRSFDDTSFQGASLNLANELEALRNDLPESASSQAALEGLVKSKSNLNDLIDRLQNAGDPVWRTIVNPMFANQWNTINKQHFKGDGNTSVVVIRDTPTRFRTAQAKNNPTVLAQNQIAISSAVTEAALNVVGGLSGLGKVDFGKDKADDEQPFEAGKNEALALDIDYQKTVIRNLKSELAQLLAEINALPDDADVRKVEKLRQSAKARMSAYATALSLAGSDTDE